MPSFWAQIIHCGILVFCWYFRKHGVYWYIGPPKRGILVSNGNLDKKHEVYWYFWENSEKMRYIGMKPYIVHNTVSRPTPLRRSSLLPLLLAGVDFRLKIHIRF